MSKTSRTKNTFKNSLTALIVQMITIFLTFACRTVFIKVLGTDYLGINGLFGNILTMLSLAEMGIGSAIVFNMYRAIKEKNEEKINELMSFYAKVYLLIGIAIMVIGFIFSFFVHYLIKDNSFDKSFLQISFILFVANNAASYFLSYRSCILFADQKDWICKLASLIVVIIGNTAQIVLLIVTKNFILYLIVQIFITIVTGLVYYFLSKKLYPTVKISFKSRLSRDTSIDIKKRVGSLMVHSVSGALNFGTDNIIISRFVGITETGLYSNYSMLISTINGLITQFLNGVIASFGNLIAGGNREKIYEVFKKINFICLALYGLLTVGMITVINPFIDVWTGNGHLLGTITVLILIINFYTLGVRQSIMITRNAAGLYTNDKLVAIIKPIINLSISLILVQFIGITGVFIGTLVSQVVCDVILFPMILFKNAFPGKIREYYSEYAKNIIIVLISAVISICFKNRIEEFLGGIWLFLACGTISVTIYLLLFIILKAGNKEFEYFKMLITRFLNDKRIIKRKKLNI